MIASELHRLAVRELGVRDPYAGVKAASTDAVLVSLSGSGSGVVVETVAVLSTVPGAVAVTVTCSVCESPGATVPRAQATVPDDSVQGASAETKLVPAGSGSLSATAAASETPLFVTTRV